MLQDQRLYNTTEMFRKETESTRKIVKESQIKKIKDARKKIAEEQKQWFKHEIAKKNLVSQIAKQNINLAQDKINRLQYAKKEGTVSVNYLYRNF